MGIFKKWNWKKTALGLTGLGMLVSFGLGLNNVNAKAADDCPIKVTMTPRNKKYFGAALNDSFGDGKLDKDHADGGWVRSNDTISFQGDFTFTSTDGQSYSEIEAYVVRVVKDNEIDVSEYGGDSVSSRLKYKMIDSGSFSFVNSTGTYATSKTALALDTLGSLPSTTNNRISPDTQFISGIGQLDNNVEIDSRYGVVVVSAVRDSDKEKLIFKQDNDYSITNLPNAVDVFGKVKVTSSPVTAKDILKFMPIISAYASLQDYNENLSLSENDYTTFRQIFLQPVFSRVFGDVGVGPSRMDIKEDWTIAPDEAFGLDDFYKAEPLGYMDDNGVYHTLNRSILDDVGVKSAGNITGVNLNTVFFFNDMNVNESSLKGVFHMNYAFINSDRMNNQGYISSYKKATVGGRPIPHEKNIYKNSIVYAVNLPTDQALDVTPLSGTPSDIPRTSQKFLFKGNLGETNVENISPLMKAIPELWTTGYLTGNKPNDLKVINQSSVDNLIVPGAPDSGYHKVSGTKSKDGTMADVVMSNSVNVSLYAPNTYIKSGLEYGALDTTVYYLFDDTTTVQNIEALKSTKAIEIEPLRLASQEYKQYLDDFKNVNNLTKANALKTFVKNKKGSGELVGFAITYRAEEGVKEDFREALTESGLTKAALTIKEGSYRCTYMAMYQEGSFKTASSSWNVSNNESKDVVKYSYVDTDRLPLIDQSSKVVNLTGVDDTVYSTDILKFTTTLTLQHADRLNTLNEESKKEVLEAYMNNIWYTHSVGNGSAGDYDILSATIGGELIPNINVNWGVVKGANIFADNLSPSVFDILSKGSIDIEIVVAKKDVSTSAPWFYGFSNVPESFGTAGKVTYYLGGSQVSKGSGNVLEGMWNKAYYAGLSYVTTEPNVQQNKSIGYYNRVFNFYQDRDFEGSKVLIQLPRNGDDLGSTFAGTFDLTGIDIENAVGLDAKDIKLYTTTKVLDSSTDLSELKITDKGLTPYTGGNVKAQSIIAVMPKMPKNSSVLLKPIIQPTGNKDGDVYKSISYFQRDLDETEDMKSTVATTTVYEVNRKIQGKVFWDLANNGVLTDQLVQNEIPLTLYQQNGDGSETIVTEDADGNKLPALKASKSSYTISNLAPGTYFVAADLAKLFADDVISDVSPFENNMAFKQWNGRTYRTEAINIPDQEKFTATADLGLLAVPEFKGSVDFFQNDKSVNNQAIDVGTTLHVVETLTPENEGWSTRYVGFEPKYIESIADVEDFKNMKVEKVTKTGERIDLEAYAKEGNRIVADFGVDDGSTYELVYDVDVPVNVSAARILSGKPSITGSDSYLSDGKAAEKYMTNVPAVYVAPKPKITKAVDKTEARVGDELTYTLTVINEQGGSNWYDVVLEDTIPEGTEYVANSTTLNQAAVADEDVFSNGKFAVDLGTVESGSAEAQKVVTFKVKIVSVPDSKQVVNTASATGKNANLSGASDVDSEASVSSEAKAGFVPVYMTIWVDESVKDLVIPDQVPIQIISDASKKAETVMVNTVKKGSNLPTTDFYQAINKLDSSSDSKTIVNIPAYYVEEGFSFKVVVPEGFGTSANQTFHGNTGGGSSAIGDQLFMRPHVSRNITGIGLTVDDRGIRVGFALMANGFDGEYSLSQVK